MRQPDLKWHGIEFSQPALAEARWLLRERILYLVKSSPYLFYKTKFVNSKVNDISYECKWHKDFIALESPNNWQRQIEVTRPALRQD